MNILIKSAIATIFGIGFSVGAAQAALPQKGKPDNQAKAQQTQTAPKAIERPAVAPESCPAVGAGTVRVNCVAEVSTDRNGKQIRVIPIYNATKVSVCLNELGGCTERR